MKVVTELGPSFKKAWPYLKNGIGAVKESIERESKRGRESLMAKGLMHRRLQRLHQEAPVLLYPPNSGFLFGTNAVRDGHGSLNASLFQNGELSSVNLSYEQLKLLKTQQYILEWLPSLLMVPGIR